MSSCHLKIKELELLPCMVKFSLWCYWWFICLFSTVTPLALWWAALIFFPEFDINFSAVAVEKNPVACSKCLDISYDNLFSGLVYHPTPPIPFCSFSYMLFSPATSNDLGCWERASPIPTEMPIVALRVLTGSFKAEGCPLLITSPFFSRHSLKRTRCVQREARVDSEKERVSHPPPRGPHAGDTRIHRINIG